MIAHRAEKEYKVETVAGVSALNPIEWGQLAGTSRAQNTLNIEYNPFITFDFLSALEKSKCVGTRSTGWQPYFIKVTQQSGELAACVPAYIKNHSQGEYVFDHGWAQAFERAGGEYYPKLQVTIPFTPATGPRLLTRAGDASAKKAAASAIETVVLEHQLSSAHVTFVCDQDLPYLTGQNFLHRTDQQFHFVNNGYRDYADFLESLASRKRKTLRKERAQALTNGITIERLTGADLTESVWDQFFAFYMDTSSRKWGQPYLNRQFFSLIGETMGNDILLIMAKRNERYIAGAINFLGSKRIFGRNWGCIEDHPFLHFEVCYHQAIDYAIEHGLAVVEAGAQGEHKLARGYQPVTTHSAHFIAHNGLRNAVGNFLTQERLEIERVNRLLGEHTPFRKGSGLIGRCETDD